MTGLGVSTSGAEKWLRLRLAAAPLAVTHTTVRNVRCRSVALKQMEAHCLDAQSRNGTARTHTTAVGGYDHAMRDQIAHQATELLHSSWPLSSSSFVPWTGSLPRTILLYTARTRKCLRCCATVCRTRLQPAHCFYCTTVLLYYKDTVARAAGHRTM